MVGDMAFQFYKQKSIVYNVQLTMIPIAHTILLTKISIIDRDSKH